MIGESLRFAGIFPLFFYKDRSRPPVSQGPLRYFR